MPDRAFGGDFSQTIHDVMAGHATRLIYYKQPVHIINSKPLRYCYVFDPFAR